VSPRKAVVWSQVVEKLANALQAAIGFAAQVRRKAQTTADDAVLLEGSIARAVSALKQAQPRAARKRERR
jgi:hypothetical protein